MRYCWTTAATLFVFLLIGCKKEEAPVPPAPAVKEPAPTPSPKAPAPAPADPAKPAAAALPKAEDVLPPGEVSKGSLVVKGDGYRFQIWPGHEKVELEGGQVAYRGTVKGIIKPVEVTVYVTKEPFAKPLAALVKRETKGVTGKGGKVSGSMSVKYFHSGAMRTDGHRFFARVEGKLDMRVMSIHENQAYIFHCVTANASHPWANVGSDCMIRGTTFHVAPIR